MALVSAFGTGTAPHGGSLPGSATAGDPAFAPLDDGSVVETVVLTQPATVGLGFGFCDAFVCGTSDNVECIGNLYIPRFADSLLLSFQLSPPPGSRLRDAFISGGSTPEAAVAHAYVASGGATTSGQNSLVTSAPQVSSDGSLSVAFPVPWKAELDNHYKPAFKRVCGFTLDERQAFTARFGSNYTPQYPYITVLAHWSHPSQPSGQHTVTVNGTAKTVNYVVPTPPATPGKATMFRQDDSRWGGHRAGSGDYAHRGTVPTALATLLSAFGGSQDPVAVGKELIANGTWRPDKGSDWAGVASYVKSKHLDVAESDLLAATRAGKSALFLATYTNAANAEAVVVVTGYDAGADRFNVLDPTLGETQVSWDDIAGGNPWVLEVSRPVAAA
ncbi:MAG: hypothetical protein ACR2MY_04290 [Candidatus Dormibacteria bacterium]